jgi:hypothetical protein
MGVNGSRSKLFLMSGTPVALIGMGRAHHQVSRSWRNSRHLSKSIRQGFYAPLGWLLMSIARATFLLLVLEGSCAMAQNSDLAILLNGSRVQFHLGLRTETQYRVGVQVNYAWQILEGSAGRLYLEVPISSLSPPVGQGTTEDTGSVREIRRPQFVFFATPGLRYHISIQPRLALYFALGAGLALRQQTIRTILQEETQAITIMTRSGWKGSPAFDVGGGLDFRLTRLLSLRGELRSFRTTSAPGFGTGRNYAAAHLGLAFHY